MWHIQWYFLLDITDHYPIFTIAPINCPQKQICVKFRDHSGQNLANPKIEVEHYLNNDVQINQDVSANTNNFCNNLFVIYSKCCRNKEKETSFTRLSKPWISDAIMVSLNHKHKLFLSIRMALSPLIIIILLKTISQLLYVMLEIII